jgi:peptidoglycan/xylan/chitin deacetylase (PgdA/CDA1 family)
MYLSKTPALIQQLFPDLLCRVPGKGKVVYLTFDDGPTAGVTEEVLNVLAQYGAKAAFFCLGRQVMQHPELYARILAEGHRVGNHSYNHPDGWRTGTENYLQDVALAEQSINTNIYRPPYGRLKPAQYAALKNRFRVVLWDVMPGDFDSSKTPDDCFQILTQHVSPGSIIVLHDSEKAQPRLKEILPRFLEEYSANGYVFKALP